MESLKHKLAAALRACRPELGPVLRLAGPVVAAEIGWVSMSLVDTMMVGRVGPAAIGAVSVGSIAFFAVAIFGMGMLLGLDYFVSHAFGAGRFEAAHRALFQAVYLSLFLTALLTALIWLWIPWLSTWGIQPVVLEQAIPYLEAVTWSLLPLMLYTCLRRYLQGMGLVQPIMFALISANLVNVIANWILIFGNLGAPALGAVGAGWATLISRVYMFLVLLGYALVNDRRRRTGLWDVGRRIDWAEQRELVRLGLPAAVQVTLEVGVFAAATLLAGRLQPIALASHQIALNIASFTFMVPLGLSSAGAVRVGQGLGRGDPAGAARSGWTTILIGAGFMLCAGLVLVIAPGPIVRIFTTDPWVIMTGAALLGVAAFFQLFDGVQVVATGVLRGSGETRAPMVANLIGHWFFGLPVGAALCFWLGWGVIGLWLGLSLGLIAVALVLLRVWHRRVRSFGAATAAG
ncbi:MAG TPA: MATE family efflux transporter [Acidobacteriota bacterium]